VKVTLKLYATLGGYLPPGARQNTVEVDAEEGASAMSLLARFGVPPESVHLLLLNGVFVPPERRQDTNLKPGDVLAVWPPVAGG
jgi:sulfur carrier protein ThiS